MKIPQPQCNGCQRLAEFKIAGKANGRINAYMCRRCLLPVYVLNDVIPLRLRRKPFGDLPHDETSSPI